VVATCPDLTDIAGIALHGQYATVTVTNEGFYIFDVSTMPPTLVPGGRYFVNGVTADVQVADRVAFVANGDAGIAVVDLFEAGNPIGLPTLTATGQVVSLDLVAQRLYAACREGGLFIAAITNASDAAFLGHRATASPAQRVRVMGNYAYVLCAGGRLEIVNVQNPANPTLAGTFLSAGELTDVDVKGTIAVLANTNGNVTVLNLSNPATPVTLSTLTVPGGVWGVRLSGANAYVRNSAGNLVVLPLAALTAGAPQLQEAVAAQLVVAGQPVVLSVRVTGTTPLTYRWSRNNQPLTNNARISGGTNAWLVISATEPADSGGYSVTVSNAYLSGRDDEWPARV